MDRVIKFRGECKDTGALVYGYYWVAPEGSSFIRTITDNSAIDYEVIPESIAQYTGAKNENGIEIYEGDIIEYKYYSAHKRWWSDTSEIPEIKKEVQRQKDDYSIIRNPVKLREGVFRISYDIDLSDISRGFQKNSMKGTSGDIEQKAWDFKVVGNIHENPELLKQKVEQ